MSEEPRNLSHGIIYRLDDKPPLGEAIVVALQQLAAIFVGTITPALIVGAALDLPAADAAYLINMALVASGIGTFIQVRRFGGVVGSGLLTVTGTSFAFISVLIEAGHLGGLALVFGMSLVCATSQLMLAPFIGKLRYLFTPLVSGTIVLLIGFYLIPSAMRNIVPPDNAANPSAYLFVAAIVVVTILVAQGSGRPWARIGAMAIATLVGCIAALIAGLGSIPDPVGNTVAVPIPFKYGFAVDTALIIPFVLIFIVSSMETLGDMTACSELSDEPTKGEVYWKRMRSGVFADGINSMIAAVINAFPNTSFSQNNGVIQLTGVASRKVGYIMAAMLVVLGLLPELGRWLAAMPKPVVGGLTVILFGTIAAAGIRMIQKTVFDERNTLILATGLAAGVGLQAVPEIKGVFPEMLRYAMGSSIAMGGFVMLLLTGTFRIVDLVSAKGRQALNPASERAEPVKEHV